MAGLLDTAAVVAAFVVLAATLTSCRGPDRRPATNGCAPPAVAPRPVPALAAHPAALPPLPLAVRGRDITDATGRRVKLAGVNWNGAEQAAHVVGGLELQKLATIVSLIRRGGFNVVRLPWSDDLVANDQRFTVACVAVAANPELADRRPMEVFDAVVAELTRQGLLVILDNHVSDSASCCRYDTNALWHNDRWSEEMWLADWRAMAARYQANPAVVGADLRNEPRAGPTGVAAWSGGTPGDATDWPSAAERADRAIHESGGRLLTIVEGVGYATDLTGVVHRPLAIPAERLVYSAHAYEFNPPGVYDRADPAVLARHLDRSWGYLLDGFTDDRGNRHGPAPVWLAEFGCNAPARSGVAFRADGCESDAQGIGGAWFAQLHRYMATRDVDWAWWPINGTYASGPVAGVRCTPAPSAGPAVGDEAACWGRPEDYGVLTPDWVSPKGFVTRSLAELAAPRG